jgi:hypothetical protein
MVLPMNRIYRDANRPDSKLVLALPTSVSASPRSKPEFLPAIRLRRSLFPIGLREILHGWPIRKDQSGFYAAAYQQYLARFKAPDPKLSISYRFVRESYCCVKARRKLSAALRNASYSNDSLSGRGDKMLGRNFPNIFLVACSQAGLHGHVPWPNMPTPWRRRHGTHLPATER